MPGRLHEHKSAAGYLSMDVLTYASRRDHVIAALQNESRLGYLREVISIFTKKRCSREVLRCIAKLMDRR